MAQGLQYCLGFGLQSVQGFGVRVACFLQIRAASHHPSPASQIQKIAKSQRSVPLPLQREKAPLSQNLQALFVSAYKKNVPQKLGRVPFPPEPRAETLEANGRRLCFALLWTAGLKGFGVLWFFSIHKRHSKLCLQLTVWGLKEG